MKDRTVVEITWDDAWTDFQDLQISEAKKLKPVSRTTIGWIISESDSCIVLCTDLYNKDGKHINTPIVIPTGMITEYYKYEVIP